MERVLFMKLVIMNMTALKTSDLEERTSLSQRYWQRRAATGDIPGTEVISLGNNTRYLFDADLFDEWWDKQRKAVKKCRGKPTTKQTSSSVAKRGGSGKRTSGYRSGSASKLETLERLKIAVTQN